MIVNKLLHFSNTMVCVNITFDSRNIHYRSEMIIRVSDTETNYKK